MRKKVVSFYAYKARENRQGTYLGVLPPEASEVLRAQMKQLLERHEALEQRIQTWEKDYQAYQKALAASLEVYGILPKDEDMRTKSMLIDEDGHVFWEDG